MDDADRERLRIEMAAELRAGPDGCSHVAEVLALLDSEKEAREALGQRQRWEPQACDNCKKLFPLDLVAVETQDGAFVGQWCCVCHDIKVLAGLRAEVERLREQFAASENLRRESGEREVRAALRFNEERERAERAEADSARTAEVPGATQRCVFQAGSPAPQGGGGGAGAAEPPRFALCEQRYRRRRFASPRCVRAMARSLPTVR